MHLYLFRHGQSVENTQPWDGRNNNSPLTELGEKQADALGSWLAENEWKFDKLYGSTMQRTRQTADPVSKGLGMEVIWSDRLREVGNAYPDGSPFPDDNLPLYQANTWGSRFPYKSITKGGENWMQFRARIGSFVEQVVDEAPEDHRNYKVGVICHGGVIEGVFEHIFHKGPWSAVIVHSNNTGITHLEYSPEEGRPDWWLHYHNRIPHLSPNQAS